MTPSDLQRNYAKLKLNLRENKVHSVRQNPQTLIVVTDGLKSMSQAIDDLFTQAQHQTCIVHLIRVITDFVSRKDRKAVMAGLKLIYQADSHLSDGTFFELCCALKMELKKLAWMPRRLARMQKFGKNWRKQKAAIARLHQHIANVRRDFIKKVSSEICKNHAEIFREDLKVKNMTASVKGTVEESGTRVAQKRGLNRLILDQGWGYFLPSLIRRR